MAEKRQEGVSEKTSILSKIEKRLEGSEIIQKTRLKLKKSSKEGEDTDGEDDIVEEEKLQQALKEHVVDTVKEDDEEEERKAAAFFDQQPFGSQKEVFAKTFDELNLRRPIMRAIAALGFTKPTPIQVC